MSHAGLFSRAGGPLPLRGVEIEGEVLGAYSRVRVRQRYVNMETGPIEAVYTFPLPSEASLTGFALSCAGRRLEATVKERETAFRTYDDALLEGYGAALIDAERRNVFTVQAGNLLPGEETVLELEYLQRVQVEEGTLRLLIPTLVAPRYIPGVPAGERTADGWSPPTDRVPDADRITPRPGDPGYQVRLELSFLIERDLVVESPSHALAVSREADGRVRVRFAGDQAALDRDIVITARLERDEPLAAVTLHRDGSGAGVLALTVIPDLASGSGRAPRQEVVFLIDVSGSMEGASIREAKSTLALCLRHLREGDRFNLIAFESRHRSFQPELVPFNERTLGQADAWVQGLRAGGGTELLEPLVEAVRAAPEGVIVLLTDGQVGNEEEVLREVSRLSARSRIYSFGIGTNVSELLLWDLARHTGGDVELIYPGERFYEKVVAQLARAVAPRVTGVRVSFEGLEVKELAPADCPPLVDGEPWTLFGRFEGEGAGRARIEGTLAGQPFGLELPIEGWRKDSCPALAKLWAAERIRDLEAAAVTGRRAVDLREQVLALALEHGLATRYTSFVVVEERAGERRAGAIPETRVVPVHVPAGWGMFGEPALEEPEPLEEPGPLLEAAWADLVCGPDDAFDLGEPSSPLEDEPTVLRDEVNVPAGRRRKATSAATKGALRVMEELEPYLPASAWAPDAGSVAPAGERVDPVIGLLCRQIASGLWDEPGTTDLEAVRLVRATASALLELRRAGITTAHPIHGTPVRKAVEALVPRAVALAATDLELAILALEVAWLSAGGSRTRRWVEAAIKGEPALAARLEAPLEESSLAARLLSLR